MTAIDPRRPRRRRRVPDSRTIGAILAGIAMISAAAVIASHLMGPHGVRDTAATATLATPQCANGYQPESGYDLDVCISGNGSVVTPSVNIVSVGDTGSSCSVVLEIWDDANNRLDSDAAANRFSCAPGLRTGAPLDLSALQDVTAHTAPDGSLTVHAFARLDLNGQGVYLPGQGDSPAVTVSTSGNASTNADVNAKADSMGSASSSASASNDSGADGSGSCTPPNHSGDPCELQAAQAQQENVVTATPTGSGNPFTVVDTDAGFSLCRVGTVPVSCTGKPPFGTLNQPAESYVLPIAKYAAQAGVDPRLMLIMLWNESNKIHGAVSDDVIDPTVDATACAITHSLGCDGPSLGIADMKQATFEQVKANHPDLFGADQWQDLTNNSDLAIQTLAWELHDLAQGLPGTAVGSYSPEQMLGMAYNGGTQLALDYAHGGTDIPKDTRQKLQFYADAISQDWSNGNQIFCGSGAFTCTG